MTIQETSTFPVVDLALLVLSEKSLLVPFGKPALMMHLSRPNWVNSQAKMVC